MTTLTNKEFKVLEAFLEAGMECNGARDAEEMKGDNMTWADAEEIQAATGLPGKAVAALFGSLSQKGMILSSGEKMVEGISRPAKDGDADYTATDSGIDYYFENVSG